MVDNPHTPPTSSYGDNPVSWSPHKCKHQRWCYICSNFMLHRRTHVASAGHQRIARKLRRFAQGLWKYGAMIGRHARHPYTSYGDSVWCSNRTSYGDSVWCSNRFWFSVKFACANTNAAHRRGTHCGCCTVDEARIRLRNAQLG